MPCLDSPPRRLVNNISSDIRSTHMLSKPNLTVSSALLRLISPPAEQEEAQWERLMRLHKRDWCFEFPMLDGLNGRPSLGESVKLACQDPRIKEIPHCHNPRKFVSEYLREYKNPWARHQLMEKIKMPEEQN